MVREIEIERGKGGTEVLQVLPPAQGLVEVQSFSNASCSCSHLSCRYSSMLSRRSLHSLAISMSAPILPFSDVSSASATSIFSVAWSCLSSNWIKAALTLLIHKASTAYLESINSCSASTLSSVATWASNSLVAVPLASHLSYSVSVADKSKLTLLPQYITGINLTSLFAVPVKLGLWCRSGSGQPFLMGQLSFVSYIRS